MKKFSKALKSALLINFIPPAMRNAALMQIKQNLKIDEAYCRLKNKIGSYNADKLMTQFKNEAFAGKEVNSDYIIRKLNETYEKTLL